MRPDLGTWPSVLPPRVPPHADEVLHVDWAAVERRGRRAGLLLPTSVIAPGSSWVLTGDHAPACTVRLRWMGRTLPVLPLAVPLQADRDGPSAVPAAAVLLTAYAAPAVWHHRQVAAASRWIADPVGPPQVALRSRGGGRGSVAAGCWA